MKTCTANLGLLAVCAVGLLLVVPDRASAQSCTQTLSVGANVASTVASAANGSTICLNSGNYGNVNFSNINRSGFVTVRSTTARGATISPQVAASRFIRFQDLTISGSIISSCSNNIEVRNSTFTDGFLITMRNASCSANLNLLVDGNTFGNIPGETFEGRISVADDDGLQASMGLTISNNIIGPGCQSDGVQLVGGASGVTIGPGNIFDGIVQSGTVHCDMIQFYGSGQNNTITGNWFRNGSVALTHHSATPRNTQFTNNVISNVTQIQINGSVGFVFDHNTVYNLTGVFQLHSEAGGSVTARSNIFIGNADPSTTGGATTVSYSLCDDAGQCTGTNQIIGTPTFVGGLPGSITSFAGWQLTSGSIGNNTGHDGLDRGVVQSGTGPTAPAAPTNVAIVR